MDFFQFQYRLRNKKLGFRCLIGRIKFCCINNHYFHPDLAWWIIISLMIFLMSLIEWRSGVVVIVLKYQLIENIHFAKPFFPFEQGRRSEDDQINWGPWFWCRHYNPSQVCSHHLHGCNWIFRHFCTALPGVNQRDQETRIRLEWKKSTLALVNHIF